VSGLPPFMVCVVLPDPRFSIQSIDSSRGEQGGRLVKKKVDNGRWERMDGEGGECVARF
jgi:hypothetical protein